MARSMKAIARHDYTDSVWDVWVERWKSTEGDWAVEGHVRVKADGKYDAIVEACEVLGMSRMAAEQIAMES